MPVSMLWVVAAAVGAAIGSFLNVCIHRLPAERSVIAPRSSCPTCGTPVAWYDNVPILSYVLLRGRCRRCGAPISTQYPLIELATALIWLAAAVRFGPTVEALHSAVLLTLLLGIAMTDLRDMVIPDPFSLGGLAIGLAFAALPGGLSFLDAAIGAAMGYILLWAVKLIAESILRRPALGVGDIHMMAMVGAFLGPAGALLTVLLGSLLGLVIGVPIVWLRGRLTPLETYLPLGVFLALGAAISHAWGPSILRWYLGALLGGGVPATPLATQPPEAPAVATAPLTPPHDRPITIAFAGDIHFERVLASRLDDPARALAPIAPILAAADLTIVNLESAVGSGGRPEPKRYVFQASPTVFEALAAAGVDVVTMANNHAADYGRDGVRDALAAATRAVSADPPLAVIGVGHTVEEAFAPAVLDIGGTTIAVLGASAADHDPKADPTGHLAATGDEPGTADAVDPSRLIQAVEQALAEADVVVVYLHWGVQGEPCPSSAQADLARALADAGVDIVVGTHAHRLQGAGMLGETFVAYGLGNFVFSYAQNPRTATTGLLTVAVDSAGVVEYGWAPARIGANGMPEFATGADAGRLIAAFDELRECTDLSSRIARARPD